MPALNRLLVVTGLIWQATQAAPSWTADDQSVYAALLARRELRREVDRMAAGAGLAVPAPAVVVDLSLSLCDPRVPPIRLIGCVRPETVETLTSPGERPRRRFANVLSLDAARDLGAAFRDRNAVGAPLRDMTLPEVIWAAPDALSAAMKQAADRARGWVVFSRPGYSSGRALVEARYICGGLCGSSWYFLLERRGNAWNVIATELISVS